MRRTLFISNFKRVISVIAVVAITLFMISKISFLLENKTSAKNYASFFTKDEDYDVFFIGSSHVRYGFYPMELWNDYGITSYNLAGDASTLAVDYWILRQAFHFHMPKIVVLDVFDFAPNAIVYRWEHVHDSTGAFPISLDKIRMVKDLARDPEWVDGFGESTSEKWNLIFKIVEYHDRWASLLPTDYDSYKDYIEESEIRKGAKALTEIATRVPKIYPDTIDAKYDETSKEYLEKIIDLCKANDIQVLLVNTGYDCNDAAKIFADSVPEIADKHGLEYIDFTEMDLIDFNCDLQTTGDNTHVNASGGIKFTRFIGDKLSRDYGLTDHKEDPACAKWHDDYVKYRNHMDQNLMGTSSLDEYLELLYGTDYDISLEIYDNSILTEGHNASMLNNLGVNINELSNETVIKVTSADNGKIIQYDKAFDVQDSCRARIKVYDSVKQRIVDERTF